MPLFEYKCALCHTIVEVLLRTKDTPPQKCQKCGGPLVKIISTPAIQFKGKGWYITDYAKKTPSAAEEKPAPKAAPHTDAKKPSGSSSSSSD
jgi:putative FmdB family regulatory protein